MSSFRRRRRVFGALGILAIAVAVAAAILHHDSDPPSRPPPPRSSSSASRMNDSENIELATLGGGCFWCTEAVMERLPGVADVVSGYMGGHVDKPSYEQVCSKTTGHVEVIQVSFDPAVIDYAEILEIFWQAHDPTSVDRQGNDSGRQYRSVIFYHSPGQQAAAEKSRAALDQSGAYANPAVTEIRPAVAFWPAEREHQDFYRLNPDYGYCRAIIHPKLKKLGME